MKIFKHDFWLAGGYAASQSKSKLEKSAIHISQQQLNMT